MTAQLNISLNPEDQLSKTDALSCMEKCGQDITADDLTYLKFSSDKTELSSKSGKSQLQISTQMALQLYHAKKWEIWQWYLTFPWIWNHISELFPRKSLHHFQRV